MELWKTKMPWNLYQAQMAVRSAIVLASLYHPSAQRTGSWLCLLLSTAYKFPLVLICCDMTWLDTLFLETTFKYTTISHCNWFNWWGEVPMQKNMLILKISMPKLCVNRWGDCWPSANWWYPLIYTGHSLFCACSRLWW